MKKLSILILLIAPFLFTLSSCKKKSDTEVQLLYMTVKLPNNELKHDLYYKIPLIERSIELDFSEDINSGAVSGNILFSDKNGDLTAQFDIQTSGNKVMLLLKTGYNWKQGWKYYINLLTGLKSEGGLSLQGDQVIELRTGMGYGLESAPLLGATANGRNALAIISDIHMGDPRAYTKDYCWFGKNQHAMEAFLDYVIDSNHVKTLVILGDLFDEWLVPFTISPFEASVNITSTKDFFTAVAGASVNENIFDRLKTIADNQDILLVYVPGNHDMLGTQDIITDLIPGISWEGGPDGLGKYSPFPEMMFEHGHRYDFFNCPHPLVNPGHMLPPGYFVTRLYAQGMMESASTMKETSDIAGSFEFKTAWDVAWYYTLNHFSMTHPDANAENILMGGIDGYTANMSFNGAEDMYAANIEDKWPATQTQNEVPVPVKCCFSAIWNGHSDLYSAAETQYLKPKSYKVVAFGHTHEPMLEVYPNGANFTSIYANSGSWIDADQSSHDVRTYLLIHPKAWTGSEIDVVGLYQYNPASGSAFAPKLLKEESID
jgi:UDP-2,3-diacylglucosamine pyrophosphatase LpxH